MCVREPVCVCVRGTVMAEGTFMCLCVCVFRHVYRSGSFIVIKISCIVYFYYVCTFYTSHFKCADTVSYNSLIAALNLILY